MLHAFAVMARWNAICSEFFHYDELYFSQVSFPIVILSHASPNIPPRNAALVFDLFSCLGAIWEVLFIFYVIIYSWHSHDCPIEWWQHI